MTLSSIIALIDVTDYIFSRFKNTDKEMGGSHFKVVFLSESDSDSNPPR